MVIHGLTKKVDVFFATFSKNDIFLKIAQLMLIMLNMLTYV